MSSLYVDNIVFFRSIEDESHEEQEGPQHENRADDPGKDRHPEAILLQMTQPSPDGDQREENDIGRKQAATDE